MMRYFSLRQLLLTFAAVFIILFISHIERYKEWGERLSAYWDDYEEQKENLEVETRLQYYGPTLNVCNIIKKQIDTGKHNAVVVFPPREYFSKNNIPFTPPEPSVFYYFTGMKAVWMTTPEASKATHFVEITNTDVKILPIRSKAEFDQIAAPYKNYQL